MGGDKVKWATGSGNTALMSAEPVKNGGCRVQLRNYRFAQGPGMQPSVQGGSGDMSLGTMSQLFDIFGGPGFR